MSRFQNCHQESNLTKFSWRKHRKHLFAKFGKSPELAHTSGILVWKWQCSELQSSYVLLHVFLSQCLQLITCITQSKFLSTSEWLHLSVNTFIKSIMLPKVLNYLNPLLSSGNFSQAQGGVDYPLFGKRAPALSVLIF